MSRFSSTFIFRLAALVALSGEALAQNGTEKVPTFGDTVQILGNMERSDIDFQDGLALDLFSPRNLTAVVQQNRSPLPATFVTGTTGEGFVALSPYSYIIKLSEPADDLIAKIEIPYTAETLARAGVQDSNTYVGTLAADRRSWVVSDPQRNVHRSENVTRIIKMTSLDGEYLLLGRKSVDTTNVFVQYGQGETRTVNITAGGTQDAEFVDGLRFSIATGQNMRMNVDFRTGMQPNLMPPGMTAVNSYAWAVNTSSPSGGVIGTMMFPFNPRLSSGGVVPALAIGHRSFNAQPNEVFKLLPNSSVALNSVGNTNRVVVRNLQQVDGQYVLLAMGSAAATGSSPSAQGASGLTGSQPVRAGAGGRRSLGGGQMERLVMVILCGLFVMPL